MTKEEVKNYSALDHFMRANEIKAFHGELDEIEKIKLLHPKVTFRYSISPSETLSSSPIPLDFSKAHLNVCFRVGEKDAEAAVALGPGGYLKAKQELRARKMNHEKVSLNDIISQRLLVKLNLKPDSI